MIIDILYWIWKYSTPILFIGFIAGYIYFKKRKYDKERKQKESALIAGRRVSVSVKSGIKVITIDFVNFENKIVVSDSVEYKFKHIVF